MRVSREVTFWVGGGLLSLGLLAAGFSRGTPEDAPRVVPWVTYAGLQGRQAVFHVNYVTPRAVESILLTATDHEKLQRTLADDATLKHVRAEDTAHFGKLGITLDVYRGKPAGRPSGQIVPYLATLHRHRLRLTEDTSYAVWDGVALSGAFRLRVPTLEFTAVHVGHTCSLRTGPDDFEVYPKEQLELLRRTAPALVLHSGDVFVSVFDWERMKRESLDIFWPILPSSPLLISPANHDQGWPQERKGGAPEAFRYLFPFPYDGDSLHYRADYGLFRFVMVNYVDFFEEAGAQRAKRFIQESIDSWPGPVVMVWGGSNRDFWGTVDELSKKNPRLRLVLGGDGGRHAQRELDHGAWHVHNRIGSVIVARFTPKQIGLAVHRNERVEAEITVAVE